MTQLILQNVTKRFHQAYAVDHVDLSVPDGKLVCFLGPSGCGKTTLMRIIAGLEAPTSGTLTFAGRDLSRHHRDDVGIDVKLQFHASLRSTVQTNRSRSRTGSP